MQRAPTESTEQRPRSIDSPPAPRPGQLLQHGPCQLPARPAGRSVSDGSPRRPGRDAPDAPGAGDAVVADGPRRLSVADGRGRRPVVGQRIVDYENALLSSAPRRAAGFKIVGRPDASGGTQLTDFPNEILTHVLSHLHPDSHAAVALVSRRFYALVTTPHAWRIAFLRYFAGHTLLEGRPVEESARASPETSSDRIRLETRYFARLTPLATWRSEYLLRTRLMRSLARGKPGTSSGSIGSSGRTSLSGRKHSAVLTYNSKLPWLVTSIHAALSNRKKPPRAIHGAGHLGVASVSDPTSGKIEKWGLEDPFTAAQLDEVAPNVVPYGLGDGPAAAPNVIDVSQSYGALMGEGFPGGRVFFRGVNESCGRYLGAETGALLDVPKIPETLEAVCSVWIAKSSAVPATTQSMCGILTGSTLGIVTAYSLGWDAAGPRYADGDMAARWAVCPGVPVISLRVDDGYSPKRKSSSRVWAVALNALGEVYYLTEAPTATVNHAGSDNALQHAWVAGRSARWHLIEATRRRIDRADESDADGARGACSPRSPGEATGLSGEQTVAEARETERLMRNGPAHFRRSYRGWDMRRRLEVDFAGDDGNGAGEGVFVIDCGLAEDGPARIRRFSRANTVTRARDAGPDETAATHAPARATPSLFGSNGAQRTPDSRGSTSQSPSPPRPTEQPKKMRQSAADLHDWRHSTLELKGHHAESVITASGMDCSSHSLLMLGEDPLHVAKAADVAAAAAGKPEPATREIPGRRARLLAVGTKNGAVVAWNARQDDHSESLCPVRVIQTDSPEITCLAVSALYLVHGGSDGLVQTWDPLASTTEPIRTLNGRSNGRVPRHMMVMNPALRESEYAAAGAIYLDPDPTMLRGVVSFGAFLRYWSYSSAGHPTGRKRRLRHSDLHGRLASRRLGGAVSGFIAAEEAEIRRENEQRAREQARLRRQFGLGALGDLTEEEALRYAQMVSEEAFLQDERRRASDSADASVDTASSLGGEATADTVTPEPSVTGMMSPQASGGGGGGAEDEGELEQQTQQAIRLSLLEAAAHPEPRQSPPPPPPGHSSGEFDFAVKYRPHSGGGGGGRKKKRTTRRRDEARQPGSPSTGRAPADACGDGDADLALALRLSLSDHSQQQQGVGLARDDFPPLDSEGVGKGKGPRAW